MAKLDRLSRDVEHIFKIQKQLGDYYKSCDLPTTDALTLSIYAGITQRKRELISIRTRQALQVKKKQRAKLGNFLNLTQKGREVATASLPEKAKANQNNQRATALIKIFRERDMILNQIVEHLNNHGFTTSTDKKTKKLLLAE